MEKGEEKTQIKKQLKGTRTVNNGSAQHHGWRRINGLCFILSSKPSKGFAFVIRFQVPADAEVRGGEGSSWIKIN